MEPCNGAPPGTLLPLPHLSTHGTQVNIFSLAALMHGTARVRPGYSLDIKLTIKVLAKQLQQENGYNFDMHI